MVSCTDVQIGAQACRPTAEAACCQLGKKEEIGSYDAAFKPGPPCIPPAVNGRTLASWYAAEPVTVHNWVSASTMPPSK